jgi:hypothetical protein
MLTLWLAAGILARQEPVARPRGDDAFFRSHGASKRFYDTVYDRIERAADRLSGRKTKAQKARAIVEAFKPIDLPHIVPKSAMVELQDALQAFKADKIGADELHELVMAQAEMVRKRLRKRNDEAALVLMLA